MLASFLQVHAALPQQIQAAHAAGDYREIADLGPLAQGDVSTYIGANALRAQSEAVERQIRDEGTAPAAIAGENVGNVNIP